MTKLSKNIAIILFWFCLSSLLISETNSPNDDILFWIKNRRLTFTDFRGIPPKEDTSSVKATGMNLTHKLGTISKSIDVHLVKERTRTIFTIYAGMNRKLSWIKNSNDSITLNHEQGHFDICEIYARILRRDIKQAKSLSEANQLFENISDMQEKEQINYDKANSFELGGITNIWKDSISIRLTKLNAFQSPVVILPVNN